MTGDLPRRPLVFGAGRTGTAVTRALLDRGAEVTMLDTGSGDAARVGLEAAAAAGARATADAAEVDLAHHDAVVPSPGIPDHHPLLVAALAEGIEVLSEPELAWRLSQGRTRLVAVTGTNGKTTTTELLAACLHAPAGGNIGTPLVDLLGASDPPALVVAELSSFQLRFADTLRPDVAVLVNIAPDHLDWHGTSDAYTAAKARIWQRQRADDVVVLNADDAGARAAAEAHPPPARTVSFTLGAPEKGQVGVAGDTIVSRLGATDEPVVAVPSLGIAGPHNVANACAAVAAALSAGAAAAELAAPLQAYRPGRHRLEFVAEVAGVRYVNDSKATNPHAAAAALQSFAPGTVVWLAGGLGKGLDFTSLRSLVAAQVRTAITIGTSGAAIADMARGAGVDVVEAGTLEAAVAAAAGIAQPGDTVLLAPACASMDQFADYADRGESFVRAVAGLPPARSQEGAACGR